MEVSFHPKYKKKVKIKKPSEKGIGYRITFLIENRDASGTQPDNKNRNEQYKISQLIMISIYTISAYWIIKPACIIGIKI